MDVPTKNFSKIKLNTYLGIEGVTDSQSVADLFNAATPSNGMQLIQQPPLQSQLPTLEGKDYEDFLKTVPEISRKYLSQSDLENMYKDWLQTQ